VTLSGLAGDYPPTDEEGILDRAHGLPTQRLYQAIKDAQPATEPYGQRGADNRLRHYDKLPQYGVYARSGIIYSDHVPHFGLYISLFFERAQCSLTKPRFM
jgi:hypothetical protein